MSNAKRDDNYVTTLLAVSSVDGVTPVTLYANPTTHRLLVDLAGGGSGTVQTISIASANGFAGTSDADPNNPTLTLSTTITGILKGNGTAISAVTIGSGLSYDGTTLSATGSGTGDVVGPASATDNALARFDTTTGKLLQDGTVSSSDVAAGAVTLATIGNNDLVLQTGNATTGSITIADGASGDISLSPNGSGLVIVDGIRIGNGNIGNGSDALSVLRFANVTGSSISAAAGTNIAIFNQVTSAVNEITLTNAATGNAPSIASSGSDTNVNLNLATKGSGVITVSDSVVPASNDGAALGNTTNQFSDLFLAEGGVINWDNGDATITQTGNDITVAGITTFGVGTTTAVTLGTIELGAASDTTIARASAGVASIEGNNIVVNTSSPTLATITTTGNIELGNASDTTLSRSAAGVLAVEGVVVPTISSTNTLTNKRITLRTGTTTSSATPTINTDNVDEYYITAQTVDITSFTTNLSGTPTLGQMLFISVIGTAARAITWGASFGNGPVALPTTTVTTTELSVLFKYDGSIWRCYASGSRV